LNIIIFRPTFGFVHSDRGCLCKSGENVLELGLVELGLKLGLLSGLGTADIGRSGVLATTDSRR